MKKNFCLILAGIVMTALLFTACGSDAGQPQAPATEEQAITEATEAPAAEAAAGASTKAAAADAVDAALETYADAKGWSAQYDPNMITVNQLEDGADFVYTGDSAGTNMVTIRCIPDKQPEELLYELTSEWGTDDSTQEEITRTEGFMPGTTDKWGFWRMLNTGEEGSGLARAAMAGEYNGEVLLFDITTHMAGTDPADYTVNDEIEAFINSITYENYEPQVMFEHVPGTYVQETPGAAEGQDAVERAHTITLNADHTGTLSFQDNVDILWSSTKLTSADGSSEFEYTIEGDALMLNMDGDWLTFQKTELDTGDTDKADSGRQTASAYLDQDGTCVEVTADLTGGWSVEFARGAVYLYDGEITEDKESTAMLITFDKDVYEEDMAEAMADDNYKEADGGVYYTGSGNEASYLTSLNDSAYVLITAPNQAGIEDIVARFTLTLD